MARGQQSGIFTGEGRIIGERGGSRAEQLKDVYQHLGSPRRGRDGNLHGGHLRGRWRTVFDGDTRQQLVSDYPPGSIVIKRTGAIASALRDLTGWPGSESGRISGQELVRRNRIKAATAGALAVWSGLSYEPSPVAFLPTPSKTISAIAELPDWISRHYGDDSGDTSGTETAIGDATTTTAATSGSNPSATALPPFGAGTDTNIGVTTLAPLPTSPNVATTLAATGVFVSGDMWCNSTVEVTIGANEYPFNALARTAEEPLDQLPTQQADIFWNDIVNSLNGGQVGNTFIGPDDCHNYPTIDSGFIN